MRQESKGSAAAIALLLLMLTACAGPQTFATLEPAKGEVVLNMKADNFSFEPNNIKAFKGASIVLRIENTSAATHNLTLNDPKGQTVQSVLLPPKQHVEITFVPSEAGVYEFYCDKPFHSGFGMKGRLEVGDAP